MLCLNYYVTRLGAWKTLLSLCARRVNTEVIMSGALDAAAMKNEKTVSCTTMIVFSILSQWLHESR